MIHTLPSILVLNKLTSTVKLVTNEILECLTVTTLKDWLKSTNIQIEPDLRKPSSNQKRDRLQMRNLSKQQQITETDKDLGLATVNLSGQPNNQSNNQTDRQTLPNVLSPLLHGR